MKIVKTLLCILTTISLQINAKTLEMTSNSDVLDKISVVPGTKWSYDGGFFQDTDNGIYIKNKGEHILLIKTPDGSLSTYTINITSGESTKQVLTNTVLIDNKGPELNYQWSNVVTKNNKTTAGPLSQLSWSFNEKTYVNQVYINNELKPNITSPLKIDKQFSHILISATDQFNNTSKTIIPFSTDFDGPEIKWDFISPQKRVNDQWYNNKQTKIKLSSDGAKTVLLNGKPVLNHDIPITIYNNSQISAIDYLGNSTNEKISWIEDSDHPIITVKTLGQEYISPSKLNVKVNQKIQIVANDNGSGVSKSEYSGTNRKWLPIPDSFIFVGTGLYRIDVKTIDNIGNELLTKIVFKITL